jgi:PAS domain-containing protein
MRQIAWLERVLVPPVFEDEKKTRVARLINRLSLYFIAPVVLATIANIIVSSNPLVSVVIWSGLLFSLAAAVVLVHYGYVQLAGLLCPTAGWLLLNLTVVFAGGEVSPIFGGYLMTILATALIFGARVGLVYAILCLLTVIGIIVAKSYALFPPPFVIFSPTSKLIVYGLWIAETAVLMTGGTYLLRTALEKAERTARSLRLSEAKFRKIVESSPGHIFYLDRDGFILDAPAKRPQKKQIATIFDGLHKSDHPTFQDEIRNCFDQGTVRQFVIKSIDPALAYQVWLSPVKTSGGPVDYLVCNMYVHTPAS